MLRFALFLDSFFVFYPPYLGYLQVPRGAVKRLPLRHELTPEELASLRSKAAKEADSVRRGAAADDSSDDDAPKKLSAKEIMSDPAFASLRGVVLPKEIAMLADESDESDDDGAVAGGRGGKGGKHVDARAVMGTGEVLPDSFDSDDEDDEDSDAGAEAEDTAAKPDDVFLLAANTEDDYSSLEVYCYNTKEGSLFIHHDFALPALPLCLAWMDYAGDAAAATMAAQCSLSTAAPGGGGMAGLTASAMAAATKAAGSFVGSFVAVGTFKPDIEIWNLDVLDPLEPALVLKGAKDSGGGAGGKKKKGKGGAAAAAGAGGSAAASTDSAGHSDAVMGLAWNRLHRHMLASSSADRTVKVWDMDEGGRVLATYKHHLGKVQSVAWNPSEGTILASASFDRTAAVVDAREGPGGRVARYSLPADCEALVWHPHNSAVMAVACEDGHVLEYDCRMPDKPVWKVKAHGAGVTGVAYSPLARGLLATSSLDKTVKLWDASAMTAAGAPTCLASKDMAIGQVFSVAFMPQSAYLLGAGGSKGMVALWDVSVDAGNVTAAGAAAPPAAAAAADGGAGAAAAAAAAAPLNPIAKRFAARLADPASVPICAVRPRPDGQFGDAGAAAAGGAGAGAAAARSK